MGVHIEIWLLGGRAYAGLADVHRRWVEHRDASAVLAVMRAALDRVRALAPPGPPRLERMDQIGRRLDALPDPPGLEEERARFEQQVEGATRRVNDARERGDDATVMREMTELSRTLFGAIFAPLTKNDARGALFRDLLSLGDDPPGPGIEHVEELEAAVAAFSNPAATPTERDEALSWSRLVDAYAVAWDREPRAKVEVDLLLPFEHSDLLEDLAMGAARGELLELDPPACLFTAEQVTAFRDELARLPDPVMRSPERVARVRRLVELAASDPGLALASWSG